MYVYIYICMIIYVCIRLLYTFASILLACSKHPVAFDPTRMSWVCHKTSNQLDTAHLGRSFCAELTSILVWINIRNDQSCGPVLPHVWVRPRWIDIPSKKTTGKFLVKHHIPHISQEPHFLHHNVANPIIVPFRKHHWLSHLPHSNCQAAEYWRCSLGLWASNAKPSSPEARLDNAPAPVGATVEVSHRSRCWENRLETPTGKPQNIDFPLDQFAGLFLDKHR